MPIDPEQPCFLRAPVKCIPCIIDALKAAGFDHEAKRVEEFTHHYRDEEANKDREEWVKKAEEPVSTLLAEANRLARAAERSDEKAAAMTMPETARLYRLDAQDCRKMAQEKWGELMALQSV